MIRVAVLYPRTEGKSFDLDYYRNKHMKTVKEKLGPLGMVSAELDSGIAGAGDSPSPYFAIGHLIFETVEAFQAAFAKEGGGLLADIPNYTDVEPVIQISNYEKI